MSILADFDFDVVWRALPFLFKQGMVFTLELTLVSGLLGLVLGTALALMRLGSNRVVRIAATGYVNFMRSVPLVLGIFWFYFTVPYIGALITGASRPIEVGAFVSAFVTFTLFEAAYFSETIRAGIQSIPSGQFAAGRALGMTNLQTMWLVVLPQATRRMTPVLLTQAIMLFQDTSLVYVLSLNDFLGSAAKIAQRDNRLVELYIFVAVVYLLVCSLASSAVKRLQARLSEPMHAAH